MQRAIVIVAVFVGGAIGTSLRAIIDLAAPAAAPWQTLCINVVGAFALGLLVSRVNPWAPAWLKSGLGTGLLGGFTTFSALALAVVDGAATRLPLVIAYGGLSIVLGIAAAWLGLFLGHRRRTPIEAAE